MKRYGKERIKPIFVNNRHPITISVNGRTIKQMQLIVNQQEYVSWDEPLKIFLNSARNNYSIGSLTPNGWIGVKQLGTLRGVGVAHTPVSESFNFYPVLESEESDGKKILHALKYKDIQYGTLIVEFLSGYQEQELQREYRYPVQGKVIDINQLKNNPNYLRTVKFISEGFHHQILFNRRDRGSINHSSASVQYDGPYVGYDFYARRDQATVYTQPGSGYSLIYPNGGTLRARAKLIVPREYQRFFNHTFDNQNTFTAELNMNIVAINNTGFNSGAFLLRHPRYFEHGWTRERWIKEKLDNGITE